MDIQWYPGHMTKAFRAMEGDIKKVDAIIYVLDSRAPYSCLNPKFEKMIGDRPIIYVLNKADLGDNVLVAEWNRYFNQGRNACMILNSTASGSALKIETAMRDACADKIAKFKSKNIDLILRAMVIGVPNSGKSTLVNNICGAVKTKTANIPGVTRTTQWVKVGEHIEILDTPGTLWPSFENDKVAHHLAYIGSISEDVLDMNALALDFIEELMEFDEKIIPHRYNIEASVVTDSTVILERICKARGYLLKKSELDISRGAVAIINDFKQGRLGKLTIERVSDISALNVVNKKMK